MTILLAAAAALAAGYCIGHHTGRTLRRAATHIEAIIRTTIPDPKPMPDWEHLAEQARINAVIADIETHWNEDAA